jgi:hypothetical protein
VNASTSAPRGIVSRPATMREIANIPTEIPKRLFPRQELCTLYAQLQIVENRDNVPEPAKVERGRANTRVSRSILTPTGKQLFARYRRNAPDSRSLNGAFRIVATRKLSRNASDLSDARFHRNVKSGRTFCARSINPFERGRPRGGRGPYGN